MKLITAVLAPERLDAVVASLAEIEVYRMTVTECRGVMSGRTGPELLSKLKLEIAVNENFVAPTLGSIHGAITGGEQVTDSEGLAFGKIFVSDLLDVVRIRTGERGPDAI